MNETKKGYVYLLISGAFWGSAGVFLSFLSNRGLSALEVAFFNLGSAALFLFVYNLVTSGISAFRINKKALLRLVFTGFVSEFLYDIAYINAVEMIGVGPSAVLLYTSPIFACIMAAVCFKESITAQKILAVALNIIGCILAVTGGNFSFGLLAPLGIMLGIAAGFLYACVTILGKYNTSEVDPGIVTFYNFFFGFLFMCLLARPWTFDTHVFSVPTVLLGLLCGTFGAAIPYLFYMHGMKKPVEASRATVFASLEPVVAMILGALIFKEPVNAISFIGVAVIVLSIAIMNRE
jgi:drug/metabolite transporter (DMT)-like permease